MANWKEISLTARANVRLAATQLKEKNRRLAAANRLRTAIRCQEKAAEKEYLALGRYYYNVLRGPDNPVAEAHCLRLDQLQAQRDRALEDLEQLMQQQHEASSVAVISGADGPTAVFVTATVKPRKKSALFHFDKGPVEITVTREEDAEYNPEDPDSEEIDLSDVESFDQDPMPQEEARSDGPVGEGAAPSAAEPEIPPAAEPEIPPAAEPEIPPAAELDENDGLPFE